AADPRVEAEAERSHLLDDDGPLHVAELPPVEVPARVDALGPAEEDVARGLHLALPLDDALAVLAVLALRQVRLQHRVGGLLDLQEERVLRVAALQQCDERASAD